jgi:hypothetical protein
MARNGVVPFEPVSLRSWCRAGRLPEFPFYHNPNGAGMPERAVRLPESGIPLINKGEIPLTGTFTDRLPEPVPGTDLISFR